VSNWHFFEMGILQANASHVIAQEKGKRDWYKSYSTRICRVERDYRFQKHGEEHEETKIEY
jgi:hypothetical protein